MRMNKSKMGKGMKIHQKVKSTSAEKNTKNNTWWLYSFI